MATKRFDLKDAKEDFETATRRSHTNWELCFICQEPSKEILECSAKRSTHLDKSAGYRNVADQLKKFQAIGQLATNIDNRIGETSSGDLSDPFVTNEAKFHKRCKNKYDHYHYQKKRKQPLSESEECPPLASTRARYSATNFQLKCFFCEKEDTNHNLTQAQTLGLDRKVRDAATALTDQRLLAKLSEGDLVATEARYHLSCLAALYNRLRRIPETDSAEETESSITAGMVLGEILDYIKDSYQAAETIPVFKLSNLKSLYCQRLQFYGASMESIQKVHSSRLKEKILSLMPELGEHKQGRDVILTFKGEAGAVIFHACYQNNEEDGMCLSKTTRIIRKQAFSHQKPKRPGVFSDGCQEESVPLSLLNLVNMMIEGTSIADAESRKPNKATRVKSYTISMTLDGR